MKQPRIAPSILSAKFERLAEELAAIDPAYLSPVEEAEAPTAVLEEENVVSGD